MLHIYYMYCVRRLFSDDGAGFAGESGVEMGDVGDDAGATFPREFDGGFDFGEHGTGLEVTVFDEVFDFGGSDLMDWFLIW